MTPARAARLLSLPVLGCAGLLSAVHAAAQAERNFDEVEIHTLHVRDDIYMLVGAGGNITVQLGDDGVLLVDAQFAPLAPKIIAAIARLSSKPIRYIVDTHYHADHIGGNANLRLAGNTVTGGNMPGAVPYAEGGGAQVIAHENVLLRLSGTLGTDAEVPTGLWPTNTFFDAEKRLFYNGEGIRIIHVPAAHTDGDVLVYFRHSDVVSTGDVFSTTGWPVIDLEAGGTYQGLLDALDAVVDLIIPVYGQDGGTLVVPGHGRLSGLGDVLDYREMVIVIRDRLRSMIDAGMTLEEIKAARPAMDYEPVYGTSTSFWTTDEFLEAAYKSLSEQQ
ncbi:MAG TPA: MBL fold metallo-hydrolase [Gammaproteobacteria bacterium]|jgi:glyoxylase-like metal-dependent hydrolase (beta-lactamase superfamily II)